MKWQGSRRRDEYAVAVEWQLPYDMPFHPNLDFTKNYRFSGQIIEELRILGVEVKEYQLRESDGIKALKKEK